MVIRQLNILNILGKNNSINLFGPRGVGKSYLCEEALKSFNPLISISLLQGDQFRRFVLDPSLLRQEVEDLLKNKAYSENLIVYIDEIQKIPSLLDDVHFLIEKYKKQVQFVLTGSSARKLKRESSNLLAGRAFTLKLHPFSVFEIDVSLQDCLKYGMLPYTFALQDEDKERFLKSYVETYLREEIFQESLIRNTENFVRFLDYAAQMNGEPINFSKSAKAAGVSTKTAQEYFSILVDTLVAFRLDGWHESVKKQLLQAPKYYFFDCGVLNAATGDLRSELSPQSFRYGRLFESLVLQEIRKQNDYTESDFKMFYWRTNTGVEVDLVLKRGAFSSPIAIEIKSSQAPTEEDVSGLLSFGSDYPKAQLLCFCRTPRSYTRNGISFVPWKEGIKKLFNRKVG